VPYIFEYDNDHVSRKESNEFRAEYKRKHSRCPKCSSTAYRVTLVGYILDMNKKEEYRDLNKVSCFCGNECTVHDLIPL
jgi:hypothetical protein